MRGGLLTILMSVCATLTSAAPTQPLRLTARDVLGTTGADLSSTLEYTTQDRPEFARGTDSLAPWRPVVQPEHMQGYVLKDWNGIGWLRGRFTLDHSLWHQSLSLVIAQFGASEIYVDGRLVRSFGTIDPTGRRRHDHNPQHEIVPIDPFLDRTDSWKVHVIAIRLQADDMSMQRDTAGVQVGFGIRMGGTAEVAHEMVERVDVFDRTTLVPFGMVLALGLLHLLFFLFDRKQRVHLLYTAFTLVFSGIFVSWHILSETTDPAITLTVSRTLGILWIVIIWVVLLLIAMMFYGRLTKARVIVSTAITLLTVATAFVIPGGGTAAWAGLVVLATIDVSRLTIKAMIQRQAGAWIVGLGLLLFTCYMLAWFFGQYMGLLELSQTAWRVVTVSGLVSMPVSMSIFLARRVGEISSERLSHERRAAAEEVLRKQIEIEHGRKTRELEEARRLQDAMRPANMPPLVHLQTAVAMRSATEVGGDYFDYIRHSDEKITVAIGDATGHGMKASVLVTATKCHFLMYGATENHETIMRNTSEGLRKLHMHGMYMCMGLLTIDGMKAQFTSAGIPPLLHYRIASNDVVRHTVKALPLGSPMIPAYPSIVTDLAPGDVLVLLTDGLPELFNAQRQTPGYEIIEEIMLAHASRTALEIGNELVLMSERWLDGHDASDDITFAVIKVV